MSNPKSHSSPVGKKSGLDMGKAGSVSPGVREVGIEKNVPARSSVAGHEETAGVLSKMTESSDPRQLVEGFDPSIG